MLITLSRCFINKKSLWSILYLCVLFEPLVTQSSVYDPAQVPERLTPSTILKHKKIAFVKQVVYMDLYCCATESTATDIIFSSSKRSGPAGLFALDCDFLIVDLENDPECQHIWRSQIGGPGQKTTQKKIAQCLSLQTEIWKGWAAPAYEHPQGFYSKPCATIDWNAYDIVITVNCAVPGRITKQYPNVLWCYYIGEGGRPSRPQPGYDCFFTQNFKAHHNNPAWKLEFPYHLTYYPLFEQLCNAEASARKGAVLEHHTNQYFEQPERETFEKACTINERPDKTLKTFLHTMTQSKYFVICLDHARGRRNWLRGNAIPEAVSAGCLVFATRSHVGNVDCLTPFTLCNSFEEIVDKIRYLEQHPDFFASQLAEQRKRTNYLCFVRPLTELEDALRKKRNQTNAVTPYF